MSEVSQVVVMGDGGVGKSALVVRFTTDTFVDDYDPTLEDNYRKDIIVDEREASLDILDTAGQEEFSSLHERWVSPADGFILMYSVIDKKTFTKVKKLKQKIERIKEANAEVDDDNEARFRIVLVGNKCDLEADRQVSTDEGQQQATEWGTPFFETSAKTNKNVVECFEQLVKDMRQMAPTERDQGSKRFCNIL